MESCLATYVHDLSPFLLKIKGDFGVRWYGFMYVLGFVGAYLLLRWFCRLKCCELKEEKVADFITFVAIFGVMLGGRLGFMLMYNWDSFIRNPLSFFDFLGGGMASHGAILGITLVVFFFARWQKISWLGLGDNIVITGPLGVFFGRLGNFINGELYGRETNHGWAMKFPNELHTLPTTALLDVVEKGKAMAPALGAAVNSMLATYPSPPRHQIADLMIATGRNNEAFQALMAETLLNPRHPSQIYQALCEGLLVFLVLLAVRLKWKNAYHGMISGLFFILYAIARIAVENVREPDSKLIGDTMTKGQFYSLFMVLIGIAFIAIAMVTKRQNQPSE